MLVGVISPPVAIAVPANVPNVPCGQMSRPEPGSLCYQVVQGGGKAAAHSIWSSSTNHAEDTQIIQQTEPEWVIADVVLVETTRYGAVTGPTVSLLSKEGQSKVVTEAIDKLNETKRLTANLKGRVDALVGPAKVAATQEINYLDESIRNYEKTVNSSIEAGRDSGKYSIKWSAESRRCNGADTCGSEVRYDAYVVRRYVGNPIIAYNKAQAALQSATQKIDQISSMPSQAGPVQNTPSQQQGQPSTASSAPSAYELYLQQQKERREERQRAREERQRANAEMNTALITGGAAAIGSIFGAILNRPRPEPAAAPVQQHPPSQAIPYPQPAQYPQPMSYPQPNSYPQGSPSYQQPVYYPTAQPLTPVVMQSPNMQVPGYDILAMLNLAPDPSCSPYSLFIILANGQSVCAQSRPPFAPGRYAFNGSALIPIR